MLIFRYYVRGVKSELTMRRWKSSPDGVGNATDAPTNKCANAGKVA
jgi:hypothetical protein